MNTLEPTGLEAAIDAYLACRPKSTTACQDFGMQQRERISQQVTSAIRAYLSALDVPAHPEGVKAATVGVVQALKELVQLAKPYVPDAEEPYLAQAISEAETALETGTKCCPLEWQQDASGNWFAETAFGQRYFIYRKQEGDFVVSYGGWVEVCSSIDVARAAAQSDFERRIRATLSHPEPVAQEAVADERITESCGCVFKDLDVPCQNPTCDICHPSPSPEQGEDTGPVTSRLNQISRRSNIWREVAETGDQGNEPLPQALDALDEAVRIARACRRELSTLRARVAELEARATPPDSDAVRAGMVLVPRVPTGAMLLAFHAAISVWLQEDATEDDSASDKRVWQAMLDATLSNQGSSSNG